MIKGLIITFGILLLVVSWFLTKKANDAFLLFPEKFTDAQKQQLNQFFTINGIIFAAFALSSVITLIVDQKIVYLVFIVSVSLYSAYFSNSLSKRLK